MPNPDRRFPLTVLLSILLGFAAPAREMSDMPTTADRPTHGESAAAHAGSEPPSPEFRPAVPEGMSLEDVFDFAESPPPGHFPPTLHDDRLYAFTLFEQLEYRVGRDDRTDDHLGWEAGGWIGGDFNKVRWKSEGEAIFEGTDAGESETDLLYSRLITPFHDIQIGLQYANEWQADDYHDRWSAVVALEGLAPYKLEFDHSLYLSEDGDLTFESEIEYDLRITQRLVLQPRVGIGFAFQDIPERSLGAGITDVKLDLRLRYEIKRGFAPYAGVRSTFLVGETENIAEAAGEDSSHLFFLTGLRFAF